MTPRVLALRLGTCGAACLTIMAAHHGRFVPLSRAERACGCVPAGTSLGAVLRAARVLGFDATGRRTSLARLERGDEPLIAAWGGDHFVVMEQVGAEHVWINDPAVGRRRVRRAEAETRFGGVVLQVHPPKIRAHGLTRLAFALGITLRSALVDLACTLRPLALPDPAPPEPSWDTAGRCTASSSSMKR